MQNSQGRFEDDHAIIVSSDSEFQVGTALVKENADGSYTGILNQEELIELIDLEMDVNDARG